MHFSKMIGIINKNKLEIYAPDQITSPRSTFSLPMDFKECILWNKSIVGVSPGVCIMGKVNLVCTKKVNIPLNMKKICFCDNCGERNDAVDYEE